MTSKTDIQAFIDRWHPSGGSESANFQLYASELADLLGVERPNPIIKLDVTASIFTQAHLSDLQSHQ